jgi:uncharacterized protein (DUF1800 family)
MTKLSRQDLLLAKGIDKPVASNYDITKDEIFNKFSNSVIPIDIDTPISGIAPHTGSFGKVEAKHLLSRTLYGFSKATWDANSIKTVTQAVDDLLNVNTSVAAKPKDYQPASLTYGQEWDNLTYDPTKNGVYRNSLKWWLTGNIVNHDNTILEKMVMFWHNHLATEVVAVGRPRAAYDYFKLLRDNALGNFKTLIEKITVNPAMLRYLNGIYNTKFAPDENYARELMELFTLGKDPASQYTEDDVKAAARVLTGWKLNADWRGSNFNSNAHDVTDKTFSSFFGGTTITGKTGAAGSGETQELINMIFTKSDVIARYMVREFYKYFVYYNITPAIETNVIIPLADDFKQNWEIKPLLKALLISDHFYDPLNQGCFIKTPMDVYGNLAKNLNSFHPNATTEKEYLSWQLPYFVGAQLGMEIGEPPGVAGWPAFYQTPKFHEIWINSDTYPKRVQYCVYLAFQGWPVKDEKILFDTIAFADSYGADAADPNKLIDHTCEFMLGLDISKASKDKIKAGSLTNGLADSVWTTEWNDHKANPADTAKKNAILLRLFAMFKFIFELPEFQLH